MLRGLNKFKFCQKLFLKHPSIRIDCVLVFVWNNSRQLRLEAQLGVCYCESRLTCPFMFQVPTNIRIVLSGSCRSSSWEKVCFTSLSVICFVTLCFFDSTGVPLYQVPVCPAVKLAPHCPRGRNASWPRSRSLDRGWQGGGAGARSRSRLQTFRVRG